MTTQRIGKYACLEIERRYLLDRIPLEVLEGPGDPGDPGSPGGWRIVDRYFPDTRLRLRWMQALAGDETIYKLTQKYRSETQSAVEATITNLYLSEAEYRLFEALPALVLEKRRYPYALQNRTLSIDVFEGRHLGLILGEVELETGEDLDEADWPAFIVREVTADPFFTGGNLAIMEVEVFRQGLLERLAGR